MRGLLCGLVLLVNLSTAVAVGYGGPDEFVLRENAKGGFFRVGHALSWETRSQIVALWLAGWSYSEVARQMRCAYNTVRNIVWEFTTSGRLAARAQTGACSKPPKMRIRELLYLKVRAYQREPRRVVEKEIHEADDSCAPRLLAAVPGESAAGHHVRRGGRATAPRPRRPR